MGSSSNSSKKMVKSMKTNKNSRRCYNRRTYYGLIPSLLLHDVYSRHRKTLIIQLDSYFFSMAIAQFESPSATKINFVNPYILIHSEAFL